MLKEFIQVGWEQSTPSNSPKAPGTKLKTSGMKGSIARKCSKVWMRPHRSMGFGEKYSQAQELGQSYVLFSCVEAKGLPAPSSKKPEERELVVDSGASMHMLSKKD